jgi:hypothetical protein
MGPSCCFKRTFSFGHDGTDARVKRAFNLGHNGAIMPLQTDFSTSVMIISDRRSSGALNATCDYTVTYLAYAPPKTMPPEAYRGSIASAKLRKSSIKKGTGQRAWGKD